MASIDDIPDDCKYSSLHFLDEDNFEDEVQQPEPSPPPKKIVSPSPPKEMKPTAAEQIKPIKNESLLKKIEQKDNEKANLAS